ncbi:recombinase family protein [Colwellia ponticola]|uniref:Recombinase family protein n=1 Tax=Colwellia ponticola TaxID=2304625 RepID=A0A8H2JNH8_9GAMM|nr:recombinase family protein [Colwellia ponticola]TMM45432.1 recombinase family protein [Colwellia ponticola]
MKKAYSYIRYSSPQQAKGDSFRRQLAATQAYCDKNGYELDQELSIYKELGISGFSGDQENLKRFIQDCETGKIEKGSLLIVENLDRLSRKKINVAMRQFLHLLEYVNIYTTQDEKKYLHIKDDEDDVAEKNDNQMLDIITSLVIMSRAYNESSTKQKRLKESWDERRENIQTKKLTSLIPHWLNLSKDKATFHIKKDRVEIIKYIYDKCIEGVGVTQLVRQLNNNLDQFPTPTSKSKLWARTSVSRILTDKSVLGEYQPHIGKHGGIGDKKRKPLGDPILDYYPQVIDEETFLKAQIARKSRVVGRGKLSNEHFSNLYRSFIKCGHCDGKMEFVNKGNDRVKGGKYLTCANSKRGGECSQNKHYKYLPLELMLLHLTTENGFMPKPEPPTELNLRLAKLQDLNEKASNDLNFLLMGDFTALPIQNKISELSKDIENYSLEINNLEDKILTFKPEYKYDDLYNDVILEEDKTKLYSNRINFNSYLLNKIESAYFIYDHCPFIIFKMKDKHVHTIILDENYNFGGCTLPSGEVSYKRLNGVPTPIDPMIWQIQENFIALLDETKNIKNKKLDNYLNRINKLINKIILDQDIELFDKIIYQIEKTTQLLIKLKIT